MYSEGLYLHTVIVFAFSTGRRLFYSCVAIGWGQFIRHSLNYLSPLSLSLSLFSALQHTCML